MQGELYSEARLLDTLASPPRQTLAGLIERLLQHVQGFADETPQSADITLVAIEYLGSGLTGPAPSAIAR